MPWQGGQFRPWQGGQHAEGRTWRGSGSRGNKAPTAISLSNSTVLENTAGAEIGFITGIDPNKRDLLTYSVDDSRFEIILDAQGRCVLRLEADTALDFETTASLAVEF